MYPFVHSYAVTAGISDPVALALIALATGVLPTINILVNWYTANHAKQHAAVTQVAAQTAADGALENKAAITQVKGLVNGQMVELMRENMNLRTALRVAHDRMTKSGVPTGPDESPKT